MNFAGFRNSLKLMVTLAGPLVTVAEEIAPAVLGPAKYAAVANAMKAANDAATIVTADWPQIEGVAKEVINEFAALKHAFDKQAPSASTAAGSSPATSGNVSTLSVAGSGASASVGSGPMSVPPAGRSA